MARQARKKSVSGIYHIIMRGINRQRIFEDQDDYSKFFQTLKQYKEISGYQIYAYCLMGNHVHLLLKVGKEPLEQVMRLNMTTTPSPCHSQSAVPLSLRSRRPEENKYLGKN